MGLLSSIPSQRGLPQLLVMGHQMEVCPLSRGMMLSGYPDAIPIPPITGWHSLAPSSCARSPIGLPCGSLSQREDYGFTTFRMSTHEWVRSRLFAGGASSALDDFEASTPGHLPFGSSLSAPLACCLSRRLGLAHKQLSDLAHDATEYAGQIDELNDRQS